MEIRAIQCLIAALAFATTQAQADYRGEVHVLVNPDAPSQEWRRVPLAGAYVAITWTVVIPMPAHAIDSCRYSELARTDERGQYVMEGPNPYTAFLAETSFMAHAPGLDTINFPAPGSLQVPKDITMARTTLAPEARLSRLANYTYLSCSNRTLTDPHALRPGFNRKLLDEATKLGVNSQQGRYELQTIEAAVRGPIVPTPESERAVVVMPRSNAVQADTPKPGTRP